MESNYRRRLENMTRYATWAYAITLIFCTGWLVLCQGIC